MCHLPSGKFILSILPFFFPRYKPFKVSDYLLCIELHKFYILRRVCLYTFTTCKYMYTIYGIILHLYNLNII